MLTRLFLRFLDRLIERGDLTVHLPDGTSATLGDGSSPRVTVRIHDAKILPRLMLNAELYLGEAYMDGALTVDGDDIHGLLKLAVLNVADGETMLLRRLAFAIRDRLRRFAQHNPIGKAQRNVAHHYDLSGELYELFLDADRQYSCAYFERPGMSLEEAQDAKKRLIARKLLLRPGMRVLDIGCGWGGMALTLAREHGVHVTGVTLSREQHELACRRAASAGLKDRVDFRLLDYRALDGEFDRIVSVGMFEHVGAPHFDEFFRHMRRFLKPDGVALLHTIGRDCPPGSTNPWIAKYIFPGGYIPAMSETLAAIERQRLVVTDVEVLRLHYAETLRAWRERFEANIDRVREIYDERFCRMWRYYLVASEIAFRHYGQEVFHFQIARNQEAVPLTRDYLWQDSDATAGSATGAKRARKPAAAARRHGPQEIAARKSEPAIEPTAAQGKGSAKPRRQQARARKRKEDA